MLSFYWKWRHKKRCDYVCWYPSYATRRTATTRELTPRIRWLQTNIMDRLTVLEQQFESFACYMYTVFSIHTSASLQFTVETIFAYNTTSRGSHIPQKLQKREGGLWYCYLSGVCVTNKTGFGFDDRIYWTFIQLATIYPSIYGFTVLLLDLGRFFSFLYTVGRTPWTGDQPVARP
jgi:hypothetical protein